MPQEAVSQTLCFASPCLELGPCRLQLETRVGMWSLELIRATKRKNDLSDSGHCQCGREAEGLESHCRTTSRRTEGISEALTRRTESVAVPAQLSPDHRAGGLSAASSPVYNGRWSSPSERLDHSGSC